VLKLGHKKSDAAYFMKGRRDGEEYTVKLQESSVEKNLGVFVDNGLSFKEHVAKSTTKANVWNTAASEAT
jgi:predicted RNA-binding protein (virulence factor B family)